MGLDNFYYDCITEADSYSFTIVDVLMDRARKTPDQLAYIHLEDGDSKEDTFTYGELDRRARAIAGTLIYDDLQNKPVLMLYPPGLEFIEAFYGCLYAGVIAIPVIPPRRNASFERIRSILQNSKAKVILSSKLIAPTLDEYFRWGRSEHRFSVLVTDATKDDNPGIELTEEITPDTVAMLQYTSGSTGLPRGVVLNHRHIMRNSEIIRRSFELTTRSMGVNWLPRFHDMGMIGNVIQPVYTGFPVVSIPPVSFLQKPVRLLKAITKYKGTISGGPNFSYDLCVDRITEEEKDGLDLSSLHTLYAGAEPNRSNTFQRFFQAFKNCGFRLESFYPCYGLAECTLMATGGIAQRKPKFLPILSSDLQQNRIRIAPEGMEKATILVGNGHPWLDTRIRIVDPETSFECKNNQIGEIWIQGSSVAGGYWNNVSASNEVFNAFIANTGEGPFLRTGDLGYYYQDHLFITGRIKDVIIIRGKNFYPSDIEDIALEAHSALVKNALAAFSVEVESEEKVVVIAEIERSFLRESDYNPVFDSIRQAILDDLELEVYAIQLLRTASIPRTSSGKIQRGTCRKGFLENTLNCVATSYISYFRDQEAEVPGSHPDELQILLMDWLSKISGIQTEKIDPQKPIALYGLNSMKAVELQQLFLEKFGIDFPPYLFFERITVSQVVERALELLAEKEKESK
jgi:acyl-CoA synthetase (AMP-forming)/AMP-acid ligase II/acyl carrier protein